MSLLVVKDLGIQFGGLKAVDDVYMEIDKGEIVGLIGPNGAGKTTVFNMLTGVYTPTKGAIRFDHQSIIGKKPYQINRLGIARTFQNIRLFREMTVLENIKLAMNAQIRYSVVSGMLRLPAYWREERRADERRWNCSPCSVSRIFGISEPATCLTDNSASSRSCGRSRRIRSSCSWTNPRPA